MRALVCGVTGQDGSYLSQFLLERGYDVIGTSRDATTSTFRNLERLGIRERVETSSMLISDQQSVAKTLERFYPDEIYNLTGQSSVGLSFEQPAETVTSIVIGTLNLLEAIRNLKRPIRLYSAGSSECFGDTGEIRASEGTPFRPRSPYAVSKVSAHNMISNYREAYGLFACTGILFNHESPLRHERFVTQKIISSAARIALGSNEKLEVGNIGIQRDWGWAPEYVEAMWKMLQQTEPDDFVIATGRTVDLEYFIEYAFQFFNLNYKKHIRINKDLFRPTDIQVGRADTSKASTVLDWRATVSVERTIEKMCEDAYNSIEKAI